jgi:hypothetical protein
MAMFIKCNTYIDNLYSQNDSDSDNENNRDNDNGNTNINNDVREMNDKNVTIKYMKRL